VAYLPFFSLSRRRRSREAETTADDDDGLHEDDDGDTFALLARTENDDEDLRWVRSMKVTRART
jgi:hypothetical protein